MLKVQATGGRKMQKTSVAIRSQLADESDEVVLEAKINVETAEVAAPQKLKLQNLTYTHDKAHQEQCVF
jgi:hypothetical protein